MNTDTWAVRELAQGVSLEHQNEQHWMQQRITVCIAAWTPLHAVTPVMYDKRAECRPPKTAVQKKGPPLAGSPERISARERPVIKVMTETSFQLHIAVSQTSVDS